ncbi:uncharacterized protein [Ptychodera flava]|uniref:uncharacterized protein n=1 Tax=Ptychodera flava TaxID=63121 RepID=UPI00396A18EC
MDKVTIYDNLPKDRNANHHVIASTLVKMGYTQLLLGCALVYAGAVTIHNECHFAYLRIPMYGGVLAILTGLLTLMPTQRRTTDVIAATMIVSFISAIFCAVVLVTVMAVALGSEEYWAQVLNSCDGRDHTYKSCIQKRQIIDTFILLMAVCEAIVALMNGILCSRLLCRSSSKKNCTQMKAYLGPQGGSVDLSPSSFMSMPLREGNNMFIMIPVNSAKVDGKDSKDIESQREDIDTAILESSALLI